MTTMTVCVCKDSVLYAGGNIRTIIYTENVEQVNMQHFAELGNLGYNGFLGQQ